MFRVTDVCKMCFSIMNFLGFVVYWASAGIVQYVCDVSTSRWCQVMGFSNLQVSFIFCFIVLNKNYKRFYFCTFIIFAVYLMDSSNVQILNFWEFELFQFSPESCEFSNGMNVRTYDHIIFSSFSVWFFVVIFVFY